MKRSFSGFKYKYRIIIAFILLGTIPPIIVGMFSYYKSSNMIQNKVDEGNTQVLLQIKMSVEQLVTTADLMMQQFAQSPIVNESKAIEMRGTEFKAFSDVENAVNSFPINNLGISSIELVNLNKGWVVNNSIMARLDDYDNKDEVLGYLKVPGSSFWADNLSLKSNNISDQNLDLDGVSLVKKLPIFSETPSQLGILRIRYSQLSNMISGNKLLGQVMILGSDGCVIADSDNNMWGRDISSLEYVKKIKGVSYNSGNFTAKLNNIDYRINFLRSEYNGWIYLSITSIKDVTRESTSIGWFTLIICLTIIALVIIIAYFISNRMYMPINKLYNLLMGIEEYSNVLGKQDELGFIEERVNFLLKEQFSLKDQVYDQVDQLKEFFILKLISNEVDKDLIRSKMNFFDFQSKPKDMAVLVTSIDTVKGTKYKENEKDLVLFAINNIVGELLGNIIVFKPLVVDEYQVTIIGSNELNEDNFKSFVYSVAENVQKLINKTLKISISIGISGSVNQYDEIHKGYLEALEALRYQIMRNYNAIIFIQDIQRSSNLKPIFPVELEEELIDSVKACDNIKAKELLHQFVERITMVEAGPYEYQVSFIRLLTDLVFLLKNSGQSYQLLIKNEQSVYEHLFVLKTVEEIENWFSKEIIQPITQALYQAEKNQYNKIVEDTLKIIHERYNTELTLEECAAILNYHPSYIRRILKKEAGISFSDYLAQYRIDMAKKWLIETEMKIYDIAEKLGYKNPENFIRSFKKIEGMTPGQYRDSKAKN